MPDGRTERRRVVIVAPFLPYDAVPHAGGVYLRHLHAALRSAGTEIVFIVPSDPNFLEAVGRPGAPEEVVLVGAARTRSLPRRALMRAAYTADGWVRRWDPTWPPLAVTVQLVTRREARGALRSADVIDVHWPEYARLLPLLRVLNPRARIVGTLHDVLSQRLARARPALPAATHRRLSRAEMSARRLEAATRRRADVVVVFSEKDKDLLEVEGRDGSLAEVAVIAPPLAAGRPTPRQPDRDRPVVTFVSLLARTENEIAALWLVRDIWPKVVSRVPHAHLELVGKGASDRLAEAVAQSTNVELTGYVPDLDAVYARASACVVPLRLGAGVKFKTVESLVAGAPTVTTPVGAEGVAGPERFAALSNDPRRLADALVEVLQNPEAAEDAAASTQAWALERFAFARFQEHVERIYGASG